MKTGRNDPCPCGSGQKYKRCCMFKEADVKQERFFSAPPASNIESNVSEEDEHKAEAMFSLLHGLQRLILRGKPHIKVYEKARKLHGEIIGNMMTYYDNGKFKRKFDTDVSQIGDNNMNEKRHIMLFNSDFDLNTNEGKQGFVEFLVYKTARNMNCITEDFIHKKHYRNPAKLEFLQSMLDSRAGLFKIMSAEPTEAYVHIEEVFTGVKYKITDISMSGNFNLDVNYIYTRIITYQGISFSTGLGIFFNKEDPFINAFIKQHKKDYNPHGELPRFFQLYNQFISDPDGIKVIVTKM